MVRILTLSFLAVLLLACPSAPTEADCDFKIHRVKAEVANIERITDAGPNQGQYRVTMEFTGSSLGDEPQMLHELLEMDTDTTFMTVNRIYQGNKYYVDVSELISGPCDPLYVSFDHLFKASEDE